jgi:hypothetical protein
MSTITITHRELLELWNGLPSLANLKGFKLGYAVVRTKIKLRPEIEALEEVMKPSEDFIEFERKRTDLCQKFVMKDDKGNSMMDGDLYLFGENKNEFEAAVELLKQEHIVTLEERQKQFVEYIALLKKPITVEVSQITVEDVPFDFEPTVAQMEVLYYLISEKVEDQFHARKYAK